MTAMMRRVFSIGRLRQERGLWAAIPALAVLSACGETPVQPAPTAGVTVYQHDNYGGQQRNFVHDQESFFELVGPCGGIDPNAPRTWGNCVTSIKIAEGWEATVYERDDYGGQSLPIVADIPDLRLVGGPCRGGDWNDCITSIRVKEKPSG